jgi:hypothetical protein
VWRHSVIPKPETIEWHHWFFEVTEEKEKVDKKKNQRKERGEKEIKEDVTMSTDLLFD